jgi:hypothetical protein
MSKKSAVNILLLSTVIVCLGVVTRAESTNADESFTVGQWIGRVQRDKDGQFIACSARSTAADAQSGVQISVLANANLWLALYRSSWHFRERPVRVGLRVDGYDLGVRTTEPPVGSILDIDLGSDRTLSFALSSDSSLQAAIGSERTSFSLKNGDKALLALLDCAQSNIGKASAAPATARSQALAPAAESTSRVQPDGGKTGVGEPANTTQVTPGDPVILTCSLITGATDRWLAESDKKLSAAVRAAALAGEDAAKTYQSLIAMRNAQMPKPTVAVLELDESRKMIVNRQSMISWGPLFTSTDVRWRETYQDGVHEAILDRVTGGVVVHRIAADGADGELLYHGTCAVTQHAFLR